MKFFVRVFVIFSLGIGAVHSEYLQDYLPKKRIPEPPTFWLGEFQEMYVLGSLHPWLWVGRQWCADHRFSYGLRFSWSPDFHALQSAIRIDHNLRGSLKRFGYKDYAFYQAAIYVPFDNRFPLPLLSMGLGRNFLPWANFDYGGRLELNLGYLVGGDFDPKRIENLSSFGNAQLFRLNIGVQLGIFYVG